MNSPKVAKLTKPIYILSTGHGSMILFRTFRALRQPAGTATHLSSLSSEGKSIWVIRFADEQNKYMEIFR